MVMRQNPTVRALLMTLLAMLLLGAVSALWTLCSLKLSVQGVGDDSVISRTADGLIFYAGERGPERRVKGEL